MYKFPSTYTKKEIKKFFQNRNKSLHSKLNKYKNNNKMYSLILEKIFENLENSKKYI